MGHSPLVEIQRNEFNFGMNPIPFFGSACEEAPIAADLHIEGALPNLFYGVENFRAGPYSDMGPNPFPHHRPDPTQPNMGCDHDRLFQAYDGQKSGRPWPT